MLSCGEGPTWVNSTIDFVLIAASLLCVLVMQKAEHDQQINRIDAKWIRNTRRLSFISVAMCALLTVLFNHAPIALLGLLLSAVILLAVDVIALENRPPRKGRHSFAGSGARHHFLSRRGDGGH